MAVTTVKCKCCGKNIDRATAYNPKERTYYCDERCANNYEDKKSAKSTPKKKIDYKPKEGTDRRDLTDYIQKIYIENGYDKHKINWTLIMSQIKKILEEHEVWTYVTIQYILQYMYEVAEVDLFSEDARGSIINLVPYYGIEAEEYYNRTIELEEAINKFEFINRKVIIKKSPQKKRFNKLTFDN